MTLAEFRAGGAVRLVEACPAILRDLVGYGLVSALALAIDCGLLVALSMAGVHYLAAATLSFVTGMFVAYALSIRFVFADRRALSRSVEAVRFFAVGIAGLGLTQVLLFVLVSRAGWPVVMAKVPTVGLVFAFNFLCRRVLVFSS